MVEESKDGRFPVWIDKSRAAKEGMEESSKLMLPLVLGGLFLLPNMSMVADDNFGFDLGASQDVREAISLEGRRRRCFLSFS